MSTPLSIDATRASITVALNLVKRSRLLRRANARPPSGTHLTSVANDAMGIAALTGQDVRLRGLKVAQRNVRDGVPFSSPSKENRQSRSGVLYRVHERVVQSASQKLSASAPHIPRC